MAETKGACGPQQVIVNSDGVRLAKCPCGTFHLTLTKSGVTLQLSADTLGEVSRAIAVALPPKTQPGIVIPITGSSRIDN